MKERETKPVKPSFINDIGRSTEMETESSNCMVKVRKDSFLKPSSQVNYRKILQGRQIHKKLI